MNEYVFTIVGKEKLHCEGCEQRVSTMLGQLSGVRAVTADAKTQRVAVKLGPNGASPEEVEFRLDQLGYRAVRQKSRT